MTAYAFFIANSPATEYYTNFAYSDFSSTANLNLVSCSTSSNFVYLTTATGNDVGNAWRSSLDKFDKSFSMLWNFECSGGSGADGFCVQWAKDPNLTGSGGGGVSAVGGVVDFRFRTYGGTNLDYVRYNTLQSTTASSMSWRQNAYYWLDYNHTNGFMNVSYSTANSKPATANNSYSFTFDSSIYTVGFGAATGGSTDNHILKSMALQFT